jgi:endonuclease/exonuclease/phosphatase family metal-dependent hydrolase
VTTHFDFFPDVQKQSAELILDRLQTYAHGNPTVLMGDFNATPESACYKVLTAPGQETFSAFAPALTATCGGTHHGFSGKSNAEPIDWILYRGGLRVVSAQVVTRRFAGLFPSDHFALSAEFEFPDT